jgi:hypothetical protein
VNRREVLEEVAAGRLTPAAAIPLLDAPADAARYVRLRSAYQSVDITADPEVAELEIVGESGAFRREGAALVVEDAGSGGRLAVRVNPRLDVTVEVVGATLSVRGVAGALRAVVAGGSARIERPRGPLDVHVASGSAVVTGAPQGDWRVRGESASLDVVLDPDADATVTVAGSNSRVDALGSEGDAVLGSGAPTVAIDATFCGVVVRTE